MFARIYTLRAAAPLRRVVPYPPDFFFAGAGGEATGDSLGSLFISLTLTDLRLFDSYVPSLKTISTVFVETGIGDLNYFLCNSASSTTREMRFPGSPVSCISWPSFYY